MKKVIVVIALFLASVTAQLCAMQGLLKVIRGCKKGNEVTNFETSQARIENRRKGMLVTHYTSSDSNDVWAKVRTRVGHDDDTKGPASDGAKIEDVEDEVTKLVAEAAQAVEKLALERKKSAEIIAEWFNQTGALDQSFLVTAMLKEEGQQLLKILKILFQHMYFVDGDGKLQIGERAVADFIAQAAHYQSPAGLPMNIAMQRVKNGTLNFEVLRWLRYIGTDPLRKDSYSHTTAFGLLEYNPVGFSQDNSTTTAISEIFTLAERTILMAYMGCHDVALNLMGDALLVKSLQ